MNILFYGASVTAQSGNSGYFNYLHRIDLNFERLAFPSSQFYNAGFFNAHRVKDLLIKPDIIFFEWSTTGENDFDIDKLYYFLNEMQVNDILPIFLILPKITEYKNNRISDDQLYKISNESKVPLLDLRHLLSNNAHTDILRDGVHTTELGAKLYANCILEFLESDISLTVKNLKIEKSLDYNISYYNVDLILNENEKLIFDFKSKDINSEVVASLIKGPSTPILEYVSNEVIDKKSFFDPWCYYERENFDTLISATTLNKIFSNSIEIKISKQYPDFSITKTGEIFTMPRQLIIKSIYTSGINNFSYKLIQN